MVIKRCYRPPDRMWNSSLFFFLPSAKGHQQIKLLLRCIFSLLSVSLSLSRSVPLSFSPLHTHAPTHTAAPLTARPPRTRRSVCASCSQSQSQCPSCACRCL